MTGIRTARPRWCQRCSIERAVDEALEDGVRHLRRDVHPEREPEGVEYGAVSQPCVCRPIDRRLDGVDAGEPWIHAGAPFENLDAGVEHERRITAEWAGGHPGPSQALGHGH